MGIDKHYKINVVKGLQRTEFYTTGNTRIQAVKQKRELLKEM